MKKYLFGLIGIVAVAVIAVVVWQVRVRNTRTFVVEVRSSPVAEDSESISASPSSNFSSTPSFSPTLSSVPTPSLSSSSQLSKVALSVPFTIQAPDGQWVQPWEDGCEEAALLMADAYVQGNRAATLPVTETKEKIKQMVDWQIAQWGGHKDIGVDEIAKLAQQYLGYSASQTRVVHNATLEDIRNELRSGNPVIVPAAGRLLGNPYFTPPGPIYHVFVLTGFDGDNFIANENGTRQGNGYIYSSTVLTQALHNHQEAADITTGDMAYLVLSR